ncbi:hypothetical protein COV15_03245 [Candidatus Woesearchaeota archaeon CG10_big_fil_rev_8_21_14_0_10_34_12]|nr:MAG: hypothetical protein COV15_03245 [Candidatus Woesearchaeota archaeon CG10_big_fil_rev_8_21_14_0_10_34_12]
MNALNNFYDLAISLPNLYRAFELAKRGKKRKRPFSFEKNLHQNLWDLHCELKNKTYTPRPYFVFYITDYKTRKIMCPDFRDSVIQHAIFIYLEQVYEHIFIYDSFACRKGKGTHRAFKRLKKFVNKHSSQDYFMKCDISKYFYSIDHFKLKEIVEKTIKDENVLWLISRIIDSHYEANLPAHITNSKYEMQEKGIPIGNLMSQLFANIYLNEFDYFVKYKLKIKHYVRYVDDFVILGNSYQEMRENLAEIQIFISKKLFLRLEEKKVQINKISFGVDFVGYVCFKRVVRVRSRNFRRFFKEFKKKMSLVYNGGFPLEKLSASVLCYLAHIRHTNSKKISEKLELVYNRVTASQAVLRGGNWNNGGNAGPFCANLNNGPANTNNNIGFRCCSVQETKIIPLRRYYKYPAQMQLPSLSENLSRNKTNETCNFCYDKTRKFKY